MLSEIYQIHPWMMPRLTPSELKQIVDVEKARQREAQKQARS